MQQNDQFQIPVDHDNLSVIECPKCENPHFKEVLRLFKISALISQSGQMEILPRPVLVCDKCGTELVLEEGN